MDPNGKSTEMIKPGKLLIEGKTKKVFAILDRPGEVLVESKDRITAGDGARANDLSGKAAVSNATNAMIFEHLNRVGMKTHFIKKTDEKCFIGRQCEMIPIEWVTRRLATGSFLKRNVGVTEGFRFNPPKLEVFYKDDANHDPQWSFEQLVSASLRIGGKTIGRNEIELMKQATVCVFEVLEKAWSSLNCVLVDMKIEFGVDVETKEILLADTIDSDSWRLWPRGEKSLMKDKQVYRDLKEVTSSALSQVKSNFIWVAEQLETLSIKPEAQVVILMGSPSDKKFAKEIKTECEKFGIPAHCRITSAHKTTFETLSILAEYEGTGIPTVFIAVAGRSNGLGPVLSGNTAYPVINCPPVTSDWGSQDVWSSLRMPSGLGCSTVLSPAAAAQCAATSIALSDHTTWSKLRVMRLHQWKALNDADQSENN